MNSCVSVSINVCLHSSERPKPCHDKTSPSAFTKVEEKKKDQTQGICTFPAFLVTEIQELGGSPQAQSQPQPASTMAPNSKPVSLQVTKMEAILTWITE